MKCFTLIIFLFLLSIKSYCQKITLTGQVVDFNNKNALGLAKIDLVGKNVSTTTDDGGLFFLNLPIGINQGEIITLRISKSGYNTITKNISVSPLSIPISLMRSNSKKAISEHIKPKSNTNLLKNKIKQISGRFDKFTVTQTATSDGNITINCSFTTVQMNNMKGQLSIELFDKDMHSLVDNEDYFDYTNSDNLPGFVGIDKPFASPYPSSQWTDLQVSFPKNKLHLTNGLNTLHFKGILYYYDEREKVYVSFKSSVFYVFHITL